MGVTQAAILFQDEYADQTHNRRQRLMVGTNLAVKYILVTAPLLWAAQVSGAGSAPPDPLAWLAPLQQTGLLGGLWVAVYFLARKVNQVLEQKDQITLLKDKQMSELVVRKDEQINEAHKMIYASNENMVKALALQIETNRELTGIVKDGERTKQELKTAIELLAARLGTLPCVQDGFRAR